MDHNLGDRGATSMQDPSVQTDLLRQIHRTAPLLTYKLMTSSSLLQSVFSPCYTILFSNPRLFGGIHDHEVPSRGDDWVVTRGCELLALRSCLLQTISERFGRSQRSALVLRRASPASEAGNGRNLRPMTRPYFPAPEEVHCPHPRPGRGVASQLSQEPCMPSAISSSARSSPRSSCLSSRQGNRISPSEEPAQDSSGGGSTRRRIAVAVRGSHSGPSDPCLLYPFHCFSCGLRSAGSQPTG